MNDVEMSYSIFRFKYLEGLSFGHMKQLNMGTTAVIYLFRRFVILLYDTISNVVCNGVFLFV